MAHNNSLEATAVRLTGPFGYRHLVAATVLFTYFTILLGVSTKATGAGLACNANWPLCDGGLLNLFPASMPSFFEWFHRVVAGITGFLILGATVGAWRGYGDDRLTKWAAVVGLVLLPIQVTLGRQTVLQFTAVILAAHYWVAMSIFGAFVVVAVRTWESRITPRRVGFALALALVLLPIQTALSPQFVTNYTPPVQATHYGVMLLVLAAALTALVAGWRHATGAARAALALAVALIPVQILFARSLVTNYAAWVQLAHLAVTLGIFLAALGALAWFRRTTLGAETPTSA